MTRSDPGGLFSTRPALRLRLSRGLNGTVETLMAMRAVVEDAVHDRRVRTLAAGLIGRSPVDTMMLVFGWTQRHIGFRADPEGIELVKTPDEILAAVGDHGHAMVDCDESSCLVAALLHAIGIRTGFLAVRRAPMGDFEHVMAIGVDNASVMRPIDAQEGLPPSSPVNPDQWSASLLCRVGASHWEVHGPSRTTNLRGT